MQLKDLKKLLLSDSISLDGLDATQLGELLMSVAKEKEKRVLDCLGEPVVVKKSGREGVYYRYQTCKSKGLTKDIISKSRENLIEKAYAILFGENERCKTDYTVQEVYELWIQDRCKTTCSATVKKDRHAWSKIKDLPIAGAKIATLRGPHIMHSLEIYCGDHQVSDKMLGNVLGLLRHIWNHAFILGVVDVNIPMSIKKSMFKTKQPKTIVQKQEEVFTHEEMIRLREYLWAKQRDTYDQAILFMSYLGIRVGELRAITWGDYDDETGVLSLNHEIVKRATADGRNYVDQDVAHTKGYAAAGQRKFHLPSKCIVILEQMRRVNGDKTYIFQSNGVCPINGNRINERMRMYCNELGIRYFSTHKFRFRFISDCYENEIQEEAIQRIAGHSSVEMTRHYKRVKPKSVSREQMDDIVEYRSLSSLAK